MRIHRRTDRTQYKQIRGTVQRGRQHRLGCAGDASNELVDRLAAQSFGGGLHSAGRHRQDVPMAARTPASMPPVG